MNFSTVYVEKQLITYKNGKKNKIQGMKYNKINENGEPILIKGDIWKNKTHKRFSWLNPTKKHLYRLSNLSLVPYWGMPIVKDKQTTFTPLYIEKTHVKDVKDMKDVKDVKDVKNVKIKHNKNIKKIIKQSKKNKTQN